MKLFNSDMTFHACKLFVIFLIRQTKAAMESTMTWNENQCVYGFLNDSILWIDVSDE